MPAACVFCAIVSGSSNGHIVMDNDACVAFLDVKPLFHGHVLVVPRDHVVTLPELAPQAIGPLFSHVASIAQALTTAMGAEGSFIAMNNVVSQSVPHLHVHVVPRTKGDGLKGFFWPRTKYPSDAAMADVASTIRIALGALKTDR